MHHAIVAQAQVENVEAVLAAVDEVARKHGVTVQLLDADAIYNGRHLESAIFHAERAFQEGRNAAKTLGGEILLYVTGERRLQNALEKAGLRPGLARVLILAIGHRGGAAIWGLLDRLGWKKDSTASLSTPNPRAMERYGLAGLNGGSEAAILERVALVDLKK